MGNGPREGAKDRSFFKFLSDAGIIPSNPTSQLSGIQVKANEASDVRLLEPKEYRALIAAIPKSGLRPHNATRVKACMQLQRWSGLSLVDATCLSKDELIHEGTAFRVKTERSKTGVHINNVIPSWLGKELLAAKNGNPEHFFVSGETTPKGAVSVFDKMYRQVFETAGIKKPGQLSHTLRHTFAVELLKAGVDIRKVSKTLGHSSVTITQRVLRKMEQGSTRYFGFRSRQSVEELSPSLMASTFADRSRPRYNSNPLENVNTTT